MTYRVEFWTRESNVIEVEAADINDLREKCDEMLNSPEHNYIWDNAEVDDGGYKIIDNPEKQYEIRYIDGHDLKYKVFNTEASCTDWAINNLWDSYPGGDFDHQIISVKEDGRMVFER